MNVIISSLSQTPIYKQITNQIKEQIFKGIIKGEEQLPSIRVMSKDLRVGIVTVKRAYEELEKQNLVITIPGRGCFVNQIDLDKTKELHLIELKKKLDEIKDFADNANIEKIEITKIINDIYGG
ncbi:GntR family transcriptional regulator [Clostridium gasigenes]|uniref:GntR family transcriptional regulator n=1 Tax=Clostridium gasigenes TaxID=94869 RepID=UPI001C0C21C7|nr:GntR family transcriptional regulator [Clostridium gasigenes]MBU3103450.1 GntR family transcriptional regulator [Clostridium gasigenes]